MTFEQLLVLALAGIGLAALYLLGCCLFPYANCGKCHGSGKSRAPSGKAFRNCRRCKGTGRRRRLGRVLLDRRTSRNR